MRRACFIKNDELYWICLSMMILNGKNKYVECRIVMDLFINDDFEWKDKYIESNLKFLGSNVK